ncbi:MAG: hypothetical protein KAT18_02925 [Candidatus Latescibacteria bacterium]|nr:hypothetical protein [Candidatus Latescibacterota bacterium]
MLGLKFADRTFRFANLEQLNDGPRLAAAGAGLLPFNAKHRGQLCSGGVERLREALDRALDRARIERGDAVVVLDGRSVLRTVFPLAWEEAESPETLKEHARWELGQRWVGSEAPEELRFEGLVRGRQGDLTVVDVWGAHPGVFREYERVIEGVGCRVAKWDCDQWAITRLFEAYAARTDCAQPAAVIYLEAESLEIALIDDVCSIGMTLLKGEGGGPFRRSWDPDDPEDVAGEIVWCVERLAQRWPAASGPTPVEASHLVFTGSVEEPDRLLAALVRLLSIRVEVMDLQKIFSVDESLVESPLIQSNLGAFALCAGGALAPLEV